MGTFVAPLGLIEEVHAAGGDVEVPLVEDSEVLGFGQERAFDDVPGVFEAVDVADLVAVIGGNGQFFDAQPGTEQLDDDLGVEVEIVGVGGERHLFQGFDGIEAVSGMEFGEVGAEEAVLDSGEDLVAYIFIERHAAAPGLAGHGHAGAEDGVGFAGEQGLEQVGQSLRRILPVAVHEGDDVKAILDGVVKADFLVAAIALVDRVEEDRRGKAAVFRFASLTEGLVPGGIVDDQDLGMILGQRLGDALDDALDGALRIVRHDENQDFGGHRLPHSNADVQYSTGHRKVDNIDRLPRVCKGGRLRGLSGSKVVRRHRS